MLFVLRIVGLVMVQHWDNIMAAKMKVASDYQESYVQAQLSRPSHVQSTSQWRADIEAWKKGKAGSKERKKKLDQEAHGNIFCCLPRLWAMYTGYFLAMAFALWFLMFVTVPRGEGLTASQDSFMTIFIQAWNFSAAPWGWLFLFSSVLETLTFVIACVCIVWPERPVPSGREAPVTSGPGSATGDGKGQCCLLIACHNSAIDDDAKADVSRTVRAALQNFAPEAIFICDNGNSPHPTDDTEDLVQRLSMELTGRRLNYVYIPEGNKTHSLYWTSERWIRTLVAKNKCPDFEFLAMIDDDVPLPPDFDFQEQLLREDMNTVAIAYTIQAVSAPDETGVSGRNWLLSMQDVEYKVSGFFKMFQSRFGSAFYAHGAVSLWRRKLNDSPFLGREILYKHDTAFHGEDMYMGLLVHRNLAGKKIATSGAHAVETYAPDDFLTLFRQRVKSWDLAAHRKFPSILSFFLCFWKGQHLLLKPFMFGEVVAVLQDWIRMYMLLIILLVDPRALAAISCFFLLLAYAQLILFNYVVMRRRGDLRLSLCTLITFPFYKMVTTLLFRQYAMMENVINYSVNRKPDSIEQRFENSDEQGGLQDFPPAPHTPDPDWFHVWQGDVNDDGDEDSLQHRRSTDNFFKSGAAKFMPKGLVNEVTAFVKDKLKTINPSAQNQISHAILADVLFSQLLKENKVLESAPEPLARPETYNKLVSRMKTSLQRVLKTPINTYRTQVDATGGFLDLWETMIQNGQAKWLYMTQETATKQPGWQETFCNANSSVLDAMNTELLEMNTSTKQDDEDGWRLVLLEIKNAQNSFSMGQMPM